MKRLAQYLFLSSILLISIQQLNAQVGVNEDNSDPDPSAMLDVKSNNKGFLAPRLTTLQRLGISSPATGLMVYDTNTGSFWYYGPGGWVEMGGGSAPGDNLGDHTATQNLDLGGHNLNNGGTVTATEFIGDGSGLTNLPPGDGWSLSGNGGTVNGINFIGTTDNMPLDLRVNNVRGLRLEYTEFENNGPAPNVIGGFSGNTVNTNASAATISGGGLAGSINSVTGDFGTVSGGLTNTAGPSATVSGGVTNTASGSLSTIGGGSNNMASGNNSAIGGGSVNVASGDYSAVPGGERNGAAGANSFAAGQRAKANHSGTFVWADNSGTNFASTADKQFLIRASNGVGINKNDPATALDVNGTITATAFVGDGSGLTGIVSSVQTLIQDSNADTKIQVEEGPDEDIIRFDMGGTEHFVMNNGRLEVHNTGESVFIGIGAGANDDLSGNRNVAVGHQALNLNTTGDTNSAFGWFALRSNTTGYGNTAIGYQALEKNTTGLLNIANGGGALLGNINGNYNIGIGTDAINNNTTGNENIGIGSGALASNKTGSDNIALGKFADVGADNLTNATAIGAYARAGQSNSLVLGSIAGVNGAANSTSVGIGTTTPASALDVVGTVTATAFVGNGSGLTGIAGDNLGGHTATQALNLNGNFLSGDGDSEGIFVDTEGKVGIGTTTPTNELHLKAVQPKIRLEAEAGGNPSINFNDAIGQNAVIGWVDNESVFKIKAEGNLGGALGINIAPGGNVGIGTVTPATELDVNGTVTATAFAGDGSGLTGINTDDADADPANELQTLGQVLTQGNDAGGADMTNLGMVSATSFVGDGSGLTGIAGDDLGNHTATQALNLSNNDISAVNTLTAKTIVGGQSSTVSGARATVVGGSDNTASGAESFVGGGAFNTASAQNATVVGGFINQASGQWSAIPGGRNNTAAGEASFAAGRFAEANHNNTFVWSDNSLGSAFSSTAANQFLISADGGVGIGTNSPANQLSVSGSADFTGNVGIGTATPANALSVSGNADFTGSIGIGTGTPESPLHIVDGPVTVSSSTAPVDITLKDDADGSDWTIRHLLSADNFLIQHGTAGGSTTHLAIESNGNVGIGTNSPANTLAVIGSTGGAGAGGGIMTMQNTHTSGFAGAYFNDADGTRKGYMGWINSGASLLGPGSMQIGTLEGGASAAYITMKSSTGNVGIGTASPDFKLEVNGDAGKPGGGFWSSSSDRRLKDVQGDFTRGLEALEALQPIYYNYKPDNSLDLPSGPRYVGVIAQEVQEMIPEAVETGKGDYLFVNNEAILWTMLNAIKELKAENDALKAQNNTFEERFAQIEAALQALNTDTKVKFVNSTR